MTRALHDIVCLRLRHSANRPCPSGELRNYLHATTLDAEVFIVSGIVSFRISWCKHSDRITSSDIHACGRQEGCSLYVTFDLVSTSGVRDAETLTGLSSGSVTTSTTGHSPAAHCHCPGDCMKFTWLFQPTVIL